MKGMVLDKFFMTSYSSAKQHERKVKETHRYRFKKTHSNLAPEFLSNVSLDQFEVFIFKDHLQ
jgi:hypothetical protein